MKIADSNQQRNPETITSDMQSLVEELKTNVQAAAKGADTFDNVERAVLASVQQIGYQALELLLALQGDGDLGQQVQSVGDKNINRSERKAKTQLRSIFGQHEFEQFTYSCGKIKLMTKP